MDRSIRHPEEIFAPFDPWGKILAALEIVTCFQNGKLTRRQNAYE
jgi:hypothetical protein